MVCLTKSTLVFLLVLSVIGIGAFIYGSVFEDWLNNGNGEDDNNINAPVASPISQNGNNGDGEYQFIQCDVGSVNTSQCCNGLNNVCNKRVNEIMFAATHNSMSTMQDQFSAPNHFRRMEESLEAGYRAFLLDVHEFGGSVSFCHGSCAFGRKAPEEVFETTVKFLDENSSEVVIFEFQMDSDSVQLLDDLYSVMEQTNGFLDKVYVNDNTLEFPLMGDLVVDNKRILLLQHDGPNCNNEGACPSGIMSTYNHMFETTFDLDTVDDLKDYDTSCAITRGSPDNAFFLLNHFVLGFLFPDSADAEEVNQYDVLESRTTECSSFVGGKLPNLIAVDFWSVGEVLRFVQEQNGTL